MSGQSEHDHISASFGDRKPAYANWFYVGLIYVGANGSRSATAEHGFTTTTQRAAVGSEKIGKKTGFGRYSEEIVTGFEVTTPLFRPHPDGIVIQIRWDAKKLLRRHLSRERPAVTVLSRDELTSCEFMRKNAGRRFPIMHDEDVPQMSPQQFWNTMPTDEAPAGFFLPRGLCEEIPTTEG